MTTNTTLATLSNDAYRLQVQRSGHDMIVSLRDLAMNANLCNGPYVYRASRACDEGTLTSQWLGDAGLQVEGEALHITGTLAGLAVEHTFTLPRNRPYLEERITLRNPTGQVVALQDLACGLQRPISNDLGRVLPELSGDRLVAVPLRHRATDPADWDDDFAMADFTTRAGREHRMDNRQGHGYVPSLQRFSEGWAWTHGEHALGIFKFNQQGMEFSVLAAEVSPYGSPHSIALRFGGAAMISGEPSDLGRIQPGQAIELGVTRFQTVQGDFTRIYYVYRDFLDEHGCGLPKGYDAPVHWNELYDNPEWHVSTPGHPKSPQNTRPITYTKAAILQEAAKARDYSCEALYLDPGWDTALGTFLWGEWLGDRKEFAREVREQYGLSLSLHTPLATWLSMDGRGVHTYPRESFRKERDGRIVEGSVCLGSRQYLDEAERRLLANCADGVEYLMYDGNWWNGGCWNLDHGHPVPYTMEDHCRANLDLAQRIHARFPRVVIEMHDMIAGGHIVRYSPIYYKYGLPGSFDDNWGFELMWQPMEDLRSGRGRALYYYNLGCNIPVYLHVDLRDDSINALVVWWYASTCRHLGIGGTHPDPMVAEAQRRAMRRYHELERFYKRGAFYGMHEQAHVHALPEENAFVVNLFNLSDESREVTGTIGIAEMGLDPDRWYVQPKGGGFDRNAGTFSIRRRLEPWGAFVAEVRSVD